MKMEGEKCEVCGKEATCHKKGVGHSRWKHFCLEHYKESESKPKIKVDGKLYDYAEYDDEIKPIWIEQMRKTYEVYKAKRNK